jgi:hypothetical protein
MIWHSGKAPRAGIEPDFMATGGLPVELKTAPLQLPNDLSVSESREAAHSCGDHNGVVPAVTGCRQVRHNIAFASGLNQFSSDVARDIERLSNRSALGYEARKFIRRRKE